MDILLFILQVILCYLISGTVHELGHILAGMKEGFKFYLFVVGPFGFKRNEHDKIIFYIEKNVSFWPGVGATIPSDESAANYKKFGRVLLAGPIASIVFGAICLPFGLITGHSFLMLLGVMPISMGIACLIPSRSCAFYSDGGRWKRMQKKDTKAVETAIWNLTQNALVQGNLAKANFDDIRILANDKDLRTCYLGRYYAYCFYKDNNDSLNMAKEKAELELLKEKVPKQVSAMFNINK